MGKREAFESGTPGERPVDMLASIVSRAGREGVRVGWNSALDAVLKGIEESRSNVLNRSCEGVIDALALAIVDMRMQSEKMESADGE